MERPEGLAVWLAVHRMDTLPEPRWFAWLAIRAGSCDNRDTLSSCLAGRPPVLVKFDPDSGMNIVEIEIRPTITGTQGIGGTDPEAVLKCQTEADGTINVPDAYREHRHLTKWQRIPSK